MPCLLLLLRISSCSLQDEALVPFLAFMDACEHEEQRAGKETSLLREKL